MALLNIQKYYLEKNRCYKAKKTRTPIGIQIHSIGCAQGTAQAVADYWNSSAVDCAVTYIVDADTPGKVLQCLPEEYYTWADGGYGNRNLITIEIAESDFMRYKSGSAEFDITSKAAFEADIFRGYETAVDLCADICIRYKWDPNKVLASGLKLISSHDEGRIAGLSTAHVDPTHIWKRVGLSMDTFRMAVGNAMKNGGKWAGDVAPVKYFRVRKSWADESSQIGAFIELDNAKAACPYLYSVFDDEGVLIYKNKTKPKNGTQASAFAGLSESEAAAKILELVHETDKSGILASVSAAQMILESGYVTTNLAKSANNCFGMKKTLSGNNWANSTWTGKTVNILTREVYDGVDTYVNADFRAYSCIEESILDHSAYLLGAKNGDGSLRYEGLTKARNYKEAIVLIKEGGYATDPKYVDKICSIITRFGLDIYDPKIEAVSENHVYKVQVGAYKSKSGATKKAKAVKEKSGFACTIGTVDDMYKVYCGVFNTMSKATKRAAKLKKLKIDAFIA